MLFTPAAFAAEQGLQQEFGVASPEGRAPIGDQPPAFGGQQPGGQTPPGFGGQAPQAPAPQVQSQALSLVGAWSGDSQTAIGPAHETDAYSPDGRYVAVSLISGQYLIRTWGLYRTTQTSQNQLRLDFQMQGYLPHQICHQAPGFVPQCQPFQPPQTASAIVTFNSPDMYQIAFPEQNVSVLVRRDPNPYLLQSQVSEQMVLPAQAQQTPPPYAGGDGGYGGGGGGYSGGGGGMRLCNQGQTKCVNGWMQTCEPGVGGGTRWATGAQRCGGGSGGGSPNYNHCDDLQQRRICAINNGTLVPSNGCLVCVN